MLLSAWNRLLFASSSTKLHTTSLSNLPWCCSPTTGSCFLISISSVERSKRFDELLKTFCGAKKRLKIYILFLSTGRHFDQNQRYSRLGRQADQHWANLDSRIWSRGKDKKLPQTIFFRQNFQEEVSQAKKIICLRYITNIWFRIYLKWRNRNYLKYIRS